MVCSYQIATATATVAIRYLFYFISIHGYTVNSDKCCLLSQHHEVQEAADACARRPSSMLPANFYADCCDPLSTKRIYRVILRLPCSQICCFGSFGLQTLSSLPPGTAAASRLRRRRLAAALAPYPNACQLPGRTSKQVFGLRQPKPERRRLPGSRPRGGRACGRLSTCRGGRPCLRNHAMGYGRVASRLLLAAAAAPSFAAAWPPPPSVLNQSTLRPVPFACRSMRLLAALTVLFACAALPAVASRLLLEEAPARLVLRVGFGAEPRPPMSSLENGEPKGGLCTGHLQEHQNCSPLQLAWRQHTLCAAAVSALNWSTVTLCALPCRFRGPAHHSSGQTGWV